MKYLIIALLPYLVLPIWHRHCDLVYENAALTKHAMSFEYMSMLFNQKTPDYLFWLLKRVILFSLQGKEFYLVLMLLFATLLVVLLCAPDLKKAYFKALLFCAVFYTIYEFGLYLVYVFSMSNDQGMALAASERYRRTALIIILYVSAVFTLLSLSKAKFHSLRSFAGVFTAFLVLLGVWKNDAGYFHNVFNISTNHLREEMESLVRQYDLPMGASTLVCSYSNEYDGLELYIFPYLTLSEDFDVVWDADEKKLEKAMDHRYLFILDEENPVIHDFVSNNFPEQLGEAVIDMHLQSTP